jgi:predicted RNA-binding Zn-ribbon protein involved in translation (DUF1610 family)
LTNNITIDTVPNIKYWYGFLTILEALDMEESTKKSVMLVVIVVCLVVAAAITYRSWGGKSLIPVNKTVWIKCINPDCNATYEMSLGEYQKLLREAAANTMGLMAIRCEKCGKNTAYLAVKCPKCGFVYAEGMTPDNRCPNCGYSAVTKKTEAPKKKDRGE